MKENMAPLQAIIIGNLQKLRASKGWSQEYVGEIISSYYAYQRLEQGSTSLKLEDAIKIARLYNVDISELYRDPKKKSVDEMHDQERGHYGLPKNSVNMSVVLDGDAIALEKQIDLLKEVNKLLVKK